MINVCVKGEKDMALKTGLETHVWQVLTNMVTEHFSLRIKLNKLWVSW